MFRLRDNWNPSNAAAISATMIMKPANLRRLQVGNAAARSGGTFSVRLRPSGVASNAQEIITEMTNPKARKTTNAFITQGGASNVGNKMEAAWINSHATTAYVIATL